jgi:hypothetical protein
MLASLEWISDVPGSAYRPFLLGTAWKLEADERICDVVLVLGLGAEERKWVAESEKLARDGGKVSRTELGSWLVSSGMGVPKPSRWSIVDLLSYSEDALSRDQDW